MSLFDQPARSGPPPVAPNSGRSKALMITVGVVLAVVVAFSLFAQFWTDKLWFDSVEHGDVFSTILWMKIGLFCVFGLVMALTVGLNMYLAHRFRPFLVPNLSADGLDRYRQGLAPIKGWLLGGIALVMGIFTGVSASGQWRTFALWRNSVPFGTKDPYFDKDVSWYVFSLPWWHFLVDFMMAALVIALIAAAVVHYLYGGIRLQDKHDRLSSGAQIQLSVLLGLLVLAKGVDYWLDRFDLVTRDGSLFDGMNYTGEHALWPARNILVGIAVVCALIFFANIWFRTWLLPSVGIAMMALSAILLGMLWPAVVQKFQVDPSVADKEAPYIQKNIDATRAAYDIADTDVQPYSANTTVAQQLAALNSETSSVPLLDPKVMRTAFEQEQQGYPYYSVGQVLDLDRYTVDGTQRAVVVGAREVKSDGVATADQNWSNLHTVYTHGDGLIAAYANQRPQDDGTQLTDQVAWAEGRQVGQKDLSSDFSDYQSKIYFGELSPTYSIVGKDPAKSGWELSMRSGGSEAAVPTATPSASPSGTPTDGATDAPSEGATTTEPTEPTEPTETPTTEPSETPSTEPSAEPTTGATDEPAEGEVVPEGSDVVTSAYDGSGGVKIGGLFNKMMFAVKFSEPKLVLSDRVHDDSRILYNRNPRDMVEKVAPWLTVDKDPFPALIDGRITWIIDGYTATDKYPQSQQDSLDEMTDDALSRDQQYATVPADDVNYMRNSVKATVDAYDGTVTLYEWDETDPMLKAWKQVFPGVVQSKDSISEGLMQHLRYPEDLFKVQRYQLARYHVKDQKDWFEGNSRWQVPEDPNTEGTKQPPNRLFLSPGGQPVSATASPASNVWSLTSVFTPRDRQEMAAFASVNSDATSQNYGKITLLDTSTNSPYGPNRVSNAMEQDEGVRAVLKDYNLGRITPIEGNLLTFPVKGGMLSVQPIYTKKDGEPDAIPELTQVIVLLGNKVGNADTLVGALADVLGVDPDAVEEKPEEGEKPNTGKPTKPKSVEEQIVEYLQQADGFWKQAAEAQKAGKTLEWQKLSMKGQQAAQKAIDLRGDLLAPPAGKD